MEKTLVLKGILVALCLGGSLHAQGNVVTSNPPAWSVSEGTLRFRSATVTAADIKTLDDGSLIAHDANLVSPGTDMPFIQGSHVTCVLNAAHDFLRIYSTENEDSLRVYADKLLFRGFLNITQNGMAGYGQLYSKKFAVNSSQFVFEGSQKWTAEKAKFIVADPDKPTFADFVVAHNSAVTCEMDQRVLHLLAADQPLSPCIVIGSNSWCTTLIKLTYRMDIGEILFEAVYQNPRKNIFYEIASGGEFSIMAQKARYSIAEQRLKIESVPYIYIADAKISPKGGQIEIAPDGKIADLTDASIEANQATAYHRWIHADVHFSSHTQYTATAEYDYISINGERQTIPFKLHVQGDSMTVGEGEVLADDWHLNEGFFFKGEVSMNAWQQHLHWSGTLGVDIKHPYFTGKRFPFDAVSSPDALFIPLPAGELHSGIVWDGASGTYRSTFASAVQANVGSEVATITGGMLTYDRQKEAFTIAPLQKTTGHELRGTACSFYPQDSSITTVGKLQLPQHFPPKTITMELAGAWMQSPRRPNEIKTDLVGRFDLDCIPKAAWEALSDKAAICMAINNTIDWNDTAFSQGLAEFLDPNPKKADKHMQEFLDQVEKSLSYNDVRSAAQVPHSLLLSGIELHYDTEYRALWYCGALGILGINGQPINKLTSSNSKIEYRPGGIMPAGAQASDTLRIYLEFDEMNWVYFEFYDEVLRTISSDMDGYNTILAQQPKKQGYRYKRVDEAAKDQYLSNFVNSYIWRTGRGN